MNTFLVNQKELELLTLRWQAEKLLDCGHSYFLSLHYRKEKKEVEGEKKTIWR